MLKLTFLQKETKTDVIMIDNISWIGISTLFFGQTYRKKKTTMEYEGSISFFEA